MFALPKRNSVRTCGTIQLCDVNSDAPMMRLTCSVPPALARRFDDQPSVASIFAAIAARNSNQIVEEPSPSAQVPGQRGGPS